jgi:hypothetical protein
MNSFNQRKYFVLKTRTLLKVSCASRTSDVCELCCGHTFDIGCDAWPVKVKVHTNIIMPSIPRSTKWSLPLSYSN